MQTEISLEDKQISIARESRHGATVAPKTQNQPIVFNL